MTMRWAKRTSVEESSTRPSRTKAPKIEPEALLIDGACQCQRFSKVQDAVQLLTGNPKMPRHFGYAVYFFFA
jgi:hypothetical protein